MFAQAPPISHVYDDEAVHTYHARHLFSRLYASAKLRAVGAALRRRPATLKPLAAALQDSAVVSRRYAGLRLVALEAIRGSESRSADFDLSFRPRRRLASAGCASPQPGWRASSLRRCN